MAKLLVLADDLTGAADAGAQLLRNGIFSRIYFEIEYLNDAINNELTAIIIDSESRHLPPRKADAKVSRILQSWMEKKTGLIYKKVDSALRGPIGAELSALLKETRKRSIPFIPAFPDNKRFTRNGYHFVEEKLLQESSFSSDIHEPRTSSFVPEILKESQPDLAVHTVNHTSDQSMKGGINVFDCESNEDLEGIALYLMKHQALSVVSGASGFLYEWLKLLDLAKGSIPYTPLQSPFLIINGSLNEKSLVQIENGIKLGIQDEAMTPDFYNSPLKDLNKFIERVNNHGNEGRHTIIRTISSPGEIKGLKDDIDDKDKLNSHGQFIGQIAKLILSSGHFKTLVVFGGDTFYHIAKALAIQSIVPQRIIEPGIAQIKMISPVRDTQCISKPGGFGTDNLIEKILDLEK